MRIAQVGYGLIGKKRIAALSKELHDTNELEIHVFDPLFQGNSTCGISFHTNNEFSEMTFDAAIVSVPHNLLVHYTSIALSNSQKVLVEKPLARNLSELESVERNPNLAKLTVGFNYRFMPAIIELKKLLNEGYFGDLISIKMELGHGGSPEDQKSWKIDKTLAGGGVVLDPGIHLIDLLAYVFKINYENMEISSTDFWEGFWSSGIEELAVINGKSGKTLISMRSSIVTWKTRFFIEVIGTDGYAEISGRGRTDGPQLLRVGRRWGWLEGKSQLNSEQELISSADDSSLDSETLSWLSTGENNATYNDAKSALTLVSRLMDKAQFGLNS